MKKSQIIEKINKLKGKGKALFLAGLVLLGSSAYVKNVKAESNEIIPTDYFSEFTFERLPIPTVFDMTIEDSKKTVIPNNLSLIYFRDYILNKHMYIPTIAKEYTIIKDNQKDNKKNKALLAEGKGILLSELKSRLTDWFYKRIKDGKINHDNIYIYYNITTNDFSIDSDDIVSYSSTDEIPKSIQISFDYLAKYALYTGDKNKVGGSYDAYPCRLPTYIGDEVEFGSLDRKDVQYELLNQEMTIEKFFTEIYMKIVRPEFWPASIAFINDTMFVPEFTEEKENQTISSNSAGVGFVINMDDTLAKIITYKYDENSKKYYDFYTGQEIELEKVDVWATIDDEPYQLSEAYHILGTYGNQVANYNQVFLPFRNAIYPPNFFDTGSRYLYKLYAYYDFMNKINNNTTIGELNDYYFSLSARFIIDYTGFDFSNNPDVINAGENKTTQLVKSTVH